VATLVAGGYGASTVRPIHRVFSLARDLAAGDGVGCPATRRPACASLEPSRRAG